MANLKEIRNRISSVKSTMQITSAMKMVSAAKLKKAQDAITAMRPYANKLTELLQSLSSTMDDELGSKYAEQREVKTVLVVAITSNRGLCGAFNSNVIKEVTRVIEEDNGDVTNQVITLGKKGNDILSKEQDVLFNNNEIFDDLTFENVAEIAQNLMDKFEQGECDKIIFVYNSFKNAATQIIKTEQFLPVEPVDVDPNIHLDYIFEPSEAEIVEELYPKSLKIQLFKAMRDSFASEHGARMTAMHKATESAKEMRDDLTLSYNKARQAAITGEILEIVGGAEALKE